MGHPCAAGNPERLQGRSGIDILYADPIIAVVFNGLAKADAPGARIDTRFGRNIILPVGHPAPAVFLVEHLVEEIVDIVVVGLEGGIAALDLVAPVVIDIHVFLAQEGLGSIIGVGSNLLGLFIRHGRIFIAGASLQHSQQREHGQKQPETGKDMLFHFRFPFIIFANITFF